MVNDQTVQDNASAQYIHVPAEGDGMTGPVQGAHPRPRNAWGTQRCAMRTPYAPLR